MKVLKILALTYFILFLVLSSRTMERSNCISSTIVKTIDIRHPGHTVQIPNCYGSKKLVGTLVMDDPKTLLAIQTQVNYLEAAINRHHLYVPYKKIAIIVQDKAPFEVTADQITIEKTKVFETDLKSGLLRAWMMNFGSESLKSDKFLQTVLADIYLYLFWNEKLEDADQINNRWVEYLYSEKDICRAKNLVADQRSFCEVIAKSNSKNFQNISIWSLRPFILSHFYDYYQKMSLTQKTLMIPKITQMVSNIRWDYSYSDLNLTQLGTLYNEFMIKILEQPNYQTMFHLDSVIESTERRHIDWDKIKGQNILVKVADGYWNPFNRSRIQVSDVQSQNWYLYENHFPTLNELSKLPTQKVRVLVGSQKPIDVHVPSLKLLAQYRNTQILGLDVRNALKSPSLARVLGWNPVQGN